MIYSKTVYPGHNGSPFLDLPVASEYFRNLKQCKLEENDIFYYDRHDLAIRLEEFDTFIDEVHWNHVRTNSNVKIFINFADDYFNIIDIERISKTILEQRINPTQVYMLVMDRNFKAFALEGFIAKGINGINVYHYNTLLKKLDIKYAKDTVPTHKFSTLSRNYHPWRLELFLYLLENDLIKDFRYSFHNFLPYAVDKEVKLDKIRQDATDLGYPNTDKREAWISKMPYDLGNRGSKWINVINEAISDTSVHLLIESHLDAYLFTNFQFARESGKYTIEEFSPAFPTEKTWRVMLCKRPFIAVTTPYFLKGLKQMGFKSFSPYIDETYDTIEDNEKRVKTLLEEIKRLANLSEEGFEAVSKGCESICEHNYNLLLQHHAEVKFTGEFEFFSKLRQIHNFSTI